MSLIIGVVSQKGGVGKSTLARLIAREFAAQTPPWDVKIADLDISQGTSYHWHSLRLQHQIHPDVPVQQYGRVDLALRDVEHHELMVFDGAPHASQATRQIAEASSLTIIPTGLALDDLRPAVLLAHELAQIVPPNRLAFALCHTGTSPTEIADAREYLTKAGYVVLNGHLPEKVGYRRASDGGRAATETRHRTLNEHADKLAQSIINAVADATNKERVA